MVRLRDDENEVLRATAVPRFPKCGKSNLLSGFWPTTGARAGAA
jgi:hypothetical protein